MRQDLKCFCSFLSLLLFLPLVAQGAFFPLVINEIAWMGTKDSANNEWVEIYNKSDKKIIVDGLILKSVKKSPKITLSGKIEGKGFYLLERSDEETVPNIKADLIYKGALSNEGEKLTLSDSSGNLIDEINCSSGWFAGNNKTKQTMERISPFSSGDNAENWKTSQESGGTPKAINSQQKEGVKNDKKSKASSQGNAIYSDKIIFSEILPSPKGPDAENEWIKIGNKNNFQVDLSGWKIKDKKGKISVYVFPVGKKIPSLGYLTLKRSVTNIVLNNSGDGLEIINPDGKIVDSVDFNKAPLNQSYARTSKGWSWNSRLTPAVKNEKQKREKTKDGPPIASKKAVNYISKKGTAIVGEKIPKTPSSFFDLLASLIIAVSSATIIFFLRKALFSK